MLQETKQRLPISWAIRFFGSVWLGRLGMGDGLILTVGLTLVTVTGCPAPATFSRFPTTSSVNSQ